MSIFTNGWAFIIWCLMVPCGNILMGSAETSWAGTLVMIMGGVWCLLSMCLEVRRLSTDEEL